MKPITSEKTLYHPRAWVYVRAAEYGPALTELCESAQCAGYALVGQSYDLPQRFLGRHSGRNALLHAVRKGLIDDIFIVQLSQLSRKRGRLRRILLLFQRKGVRVHTTEIDLRYDLYRHGLDNVLVGGFSTHD